MCSKRQDGILGVPEEIHQGYKKGGTSCDRLLRVFMNSGYDKEAFLRQITHEFKQSREVKVNVRGAFFTDDEMRDTLGLPKPT